MLEGLAILFGVAHAVAGETWWLRPGRAVSSVAVYSVASDPKTARAFRAYLRARATVRDPIVGAIEKIPDRLVTRTRTQLVSDTDWYASRAFNDYFKVGGIDHRLVSVFQLSDDGATSVIALHRALDDADFSPRERRLVNFLHAEVGRLIGGPLARSVEPSIGKLSPRLRQTLGFLLDGDSEKQVAARLGLSTATVHQYVTTLYRRFGVRNRAQLIARISKRPRDVL